MPLSNTATPRYYDEFRNALIRGNTLGYKKRERQVVHHENWNFDKYRTDRQCDCIPLRRLGRCHWDTAHFYGHRLHDGPHGGGDLPSQRQERDRGLGEPRRLEGPVPQGHDFADRHHRPPPGPDAGDYSHPGRGGDCLRGQ